MRFKSDKQRKAVMASLSEKDRRKLARNPHLKTASMKQLRRKGIYLEYHKDTDKDGVANMKDCQPLNPKKQGLLHDLNIKLLKKKEERLERKREKERRKLEDIKDELKERRKVSEKKLSIKQAQIRQKQAVLDEIRREKQEMARMKAEEQAAKKEIDKYTLTGKLKNKAAAGSKEFQRRWNDPKNVEKRKKNAKKAGKLLKKLGKEFGLK